MTGWYLRRVLQLTRLPVSHRYPRRRRTHRTVDGTWLPEHTKDTGRRPESPDKGAPDGVVDMDGKGGTAPHDGAHGSTHPGRRGARSKGRSGAESTRGQRGRRCLTLMLPSFHRLPVHKWNLLLGTWATCTVHSTRTLGSSPGRSPVEERKTGKRFVPREIGRI